MNIKLQIILSFCFVFLLNSVKAQSILIGYGQYGYISHAIIPLVDGPTRIVVDGNNFYHLHLSYPYKRWDVLASLTLYRSGAAVGIKDDFHYAIASNDMRIQRYDLGLGYNIIHRKSRIVLVPYLSVGLQKSSSPPYINDFDAFGLLSTPKYKEIMSDVEYLPNIQLTSLLGLRFGYKIGKPRRFSVNINLQYLYAPKNNEAINFYYWSPPNPYDTLYSRFEGSTTGFYKSIAVGYTFPIKPKKAKSKEKIPDVIIK